MFPGGLLVATYNLYATVVTAFVLIAFTAAFVETLYEFVDTIIQSLRGWGQ